MEFVKIAAFSTFAAIAYGILHDQVTAHLCVEYFRVAHPPLFATDDPFVLALGWGAVATWWVGLPLGLALAAAARCGGPPRLRLRDVRSAILLLLCAMATAALAAGVAGALLAAAGSLDAARVYGSAIAPEKHVAFTADAFAHLASYATGLLGGLVVIGWARARRAGARAVA